MAIMNRGVVLWLMLLVVVLMLTVAEAEVHGPTLHRVGDRKGWTQNVNYTEWALHQTFYVGDWLYFGFDKHIYNVLQVNKTSYEQCNDQGFIFNITRGGRDVFNLTEAKPFYFLSSGGYCFHGMKLAVNVVEYVPSPAPAPTTSGSPAHSGSQIIVAILLATALVWANSNLKLCMRY